MADERKSTAFVGDSSVARVLDADDLAAYAGYIRARAAQHPHAVTIEYSSPSCAYFATTAIAVLFATRDKAVPEEFGRHVYYAMAGIIDGSLETPVLDASLFVSHGMIIYKGELVEAIMPRLRRSGYSRVPEEALICFVECVCRRNEARVERWFADMTRERRSVPPPAKGGVPAGMCYP